MTRVKVTGKTAPRVVHTGPVLPRVDPQTVADALGAKPMSATDAARWLNGHRDHPETMRQRLAYLEAREKTLQAWLEHAKARKHDATTIRCLEDWLADGADGDDK